MVTKRVRTTELTMYPIYKYAWQCANLSLIERSVNRNGSILNRRIRISDAMQHKSYGGRSLQTKKQV
jgi:hypothetical protein